jgi:hypothetical protein
MSLLLHTVAATFAMVALARLHVLSHHPTKALNGFPATSGGVFLEGKRFYTGEAIYICNIESDIPAAGQR